MLQVKRSDRGLISSLSLTALLLIVYCGTGLLDWPVAPPPSMGLFENLDEILVKKLEGLTPGFSEEVSWDELGIPYSPGLGLMLRAVVPAWKVDLSGTLREKAWGVALPRPDGESGATLCKKSLSKSSSALSVDVDNLVASNADLRFSAIG